ncbi:MAG: Adenylate cyclase [Myxococcaceae bacterium]|nr:Adenylate cyclase [Myxococcaceae bacterium]
MRLDELLRIAGVSVVLFGCGGGMTPATTPASEPPADVALPPLMTYEAAIEALHGDEGAGSPLTDDQLTDPMRSATFVTACGAPAAMKVTVRVAVLEGRAYAITASTTPDAPVVARCIARAVRRLAWPSTAHRDFFTITY